MRIHNHFQHHHIMNTILKPSALILTLIASPLAFAAGGHDHSDEAHHQHEKHVTQGPNGGHVVTSKSGFAFEITVDKERKARIVFLDKSLKAVALAGQSVSGIAGERSAPTRLSFAKGKDGEVLVSDQALPAGAHVPMILMIKTSADAQPVTERFELHLH